MGFSSNIARLPVHITRRTCAVPWAGSASSMNLVLMEEKTTRSAATAAPRGMKRFHPADFWRSVSTRPMRPIPATSPIMLPRVPLLTMQSTQAAVMSSARAILRMGRNDRVSMNATPTGMNEAMKLPRRFGLPREPESLPAMLR